MTDHSIPPIVSDASIGPVPAGATWARRRDTVITVIGWLVIVAAGAWLASHIARSLIILVLAALVAYAVYPIVGLLSRVLPRPVAILIVYLLLLGALAALGYLIVASAITQLSVLIGQLLALFTTQANQTTPQIFAWLAQFGITPGQIQSALQQINAQSVAQGALGVVGGVLALLADTLIMAILSIYLVADGRRLRRWLLERTPADSRVRAERVLSTLQRVVGGYIRSQLALAVIAGVLVSGGMLAFQVNYALLLGVLALLLQFIPITGSFATVALCALVALPQGWVVVALVAAYVLIVRLLLDNVLGPRILGNALGLHPAVALAAVVIGGEAFGLWGVLFAAPVAGLLQAFVAFWWIARRESGEPPAAEQPATASALDAAALEERPSA